MYFQNVKKSNSSLFLPQLKKIGKSCEVDGNTNVFISSLQLWEKVYSKDFPLSKAKLLQDRSHQWSTRPDPTVSPVANFVFTLFVLHEFEKWVRTDGRHDRKQWSLPTGRDSGLAEWINYYVFCHELSNNSNLGELTLFWFSICVWELVKKEKHDF